MKKLLQTVTTTKSKTGVVSLLALVTTMLITAWIGYVGTSLILGS